MSGLWCCYGHVLVRASVFVFGVRVRAYVWFVCAVCECGFVCHRSRVAVRCV